MDTGTERAFCSLVARVLNAPQLLHASIATSLPPCFGVPFVFLAGGFFVIVFLTAADFFAFLAMLLAPWTGVGWTRLPRAMESAFWLACCLPSGWLAGWLVDEWLPHGYATYVMYIVATVGTRSSTGTWYMYVPTSLARSS